MNYVATVVIFAHFGFTLAKETLSSNVLAACSCLHQRRIKLKAAETFELKVSEASVSLE